MRKVMVHEFMSLDGVSRRPARRPGQKRWLAIGADADAILATYAPAA
jgi:hypothetical protein